MVWVTNHGSSYQSYWLILWVNACSMHAAYAIRLPTACATIIGHRTFSNCLPVSWKEWANCPSQQLGQVLKPFYYFILDALQWIQMVIQMPRTIPEDPLVVIYLMESPYTQVLLAPLLYTIPTASNTYSILVNVKTKKTFSIETPAPGTTLWPLGCAFCGSFPSWRSPASHQRRTCQLTMIHGRTIVAWSLLIFGVMLRWKTS